MCSLHFVASSSSRGEFFVRKSSKLIIVSTSSVHVNQTPTDVDGHAPVTFFHRFLQSPVSTPLQPPCSQPKNLLLILSVSWFILLTHLLFSNMDRGAVERDDAYRVYYTEHFQKSGDRVVRESGSIFSRAPVEPSLMTSESQYALKLYNDPVLLEVEEKI
jgi:hypothetical protein